MEGAAGVGGRGGLGGRRRRTIVSPLALTRAPGGRGGRGGGAAGAGAPAAGGCAWPSEVAGSDPSSGSDAIPSSSVTVDALGAATTRIRSQGVSFVVAATAPWHRSARRPTCVVRGL